MYSNTIAARIRGAATKIYLFRLQVLLSKQGITFQWRVTNEKIISEQPHSLSTLILCFEGYSCTTESRDSHNKIGLQYACAKEYAMIWIFKCFGFLSSAATVCVSESWKILNWRYCVSADTKT